MIILIAQLYFLWYLYKYHSNTKIFKIIRSSWLAVVILVMGFIGAFLLGMGVSGKWSKWYLIVVGGLGICNLWVIVLERINVIFKMIINKKVGGGRVAFVKNVCFILNHLGLMLFIIGGIYGMWERREFKVKLPTIGLEWRGEKIGKDSLEMRVVGEAIKDSVVFMLVGKDTVGVKGFVVESRGGGIGSYRAVLVVNGEDVCVEVNNPYDLRFGEKLYLSGYNLKEGGERVDNVVVMWVRELWGIVIKIGVIMLLFGALGMLFIKD